MPSAYTKDPEAVLDYAFDWKALTHGVEGAKSDWLAASETITTHTVTAAEGLTLDSDSETDGAVTAWVSGGTAGTNYALECKIATSAGRTDERTVTIMVRER